MRFRARTTAILATVAFMLLALLTFALWWVRHRDAVSDARYRHFQDSTAVVIAGLRSRLSKLDTVYAIDTVRITQTNIVYREAARRVDTATLVLPGSAPILLDTLPQVRHLRLACDATIAARDTALTTCEARVAALRSLFVTDSVRRDSMTAYLRQTTRRATRAAQRKGWVWGLSVGAGAVLLARVVLK